MIERALQSIAFSKEWGRQMRFITGPRQSGKTTLAKAELKRLGRDNLYYLWDRRDVRERYKSNELFFTEDSPPKSAPQWVCFDEIHKFPKWKNVLKAIFDSVQENYHFIVTGSAKFELFKKAGDSLAGRYFTFHLYPLMLSEAAGHSDLNPPPVGAKEFVQQCFDRRPSPPGVLGYLLEYGGFPEPFLAQSRRFYRKWANDYLDTVIKEDIGVLTRIIDREYLFDLYRLLPRMVGSPLSQASLASHLELSQPTIKNHLRRLTDFYLAFKVPPYSRNIKRSLLKAPKCYLYDWAQNSNTGSRFENFVATQWLTRLRLWEDASGESFGLMYIRTKQKAEIDFVVTRHDQPWLLVEAKVSDGALEASHYHIQSMLGGIPIVRVCRDENVARLSGKNIFHLSASRLFAG